MEKITMKLKSSEMISRTDFSGLAFEEYQRNAIAVRELQGQGSEYFYGIEAYVYGGKTDVNLQLVKNGTAWAYRQYLKDEAILKAEDKARNAKAGLWGLQADQIMPPWEWRHGGKAAANDNRPAKPSPFKCEGKTKCKQMISCDEARFYLTPCKVQRLDGDRDGIPCETICGGGVLQ